MRVAFANSSRIWGGAEVMTAAFLRGLQARGHEVALLCRRGSPFLARMGAEVPCHAVLGGFDANPLAVTRGMRTLKRERSEVLLTMTQKDPRVAGVAARLIGIPVIHCQPMDIPFQGTLHHRLFYGVIPTYSIANSTATRDTMLRSASWLDPRDVGIIYNGIDVDRFAEARPADLGVQPGSVTVGFVGRFEDRKGIREVMSAWPAIASAVPTANLVLAGEGGPLDADVRIWAERTERVHLIGFRDDMAQVMAAFDILVMPSYFEGFGIVLVEAMAAGVAVVASRASSLPELMDDGVEGRLVAVRDADALAAAVIDLASDHDLRASYGIAGRARATRDFNLERILDEYESLLRKVVVG